MKKRHFIASLAAAGLTLLGFGSCRTPKSAVYGPPPMPGLSEEPQEGDRTVADSVRGKVSPFERPIQLMYGVRPRQYRQIVTPEEER